MKQKIVGLISAAIILLLLVTMILGGVVASLVAVLAGGEEEENKKSEVEIYSELPLSAEVLALKAEVLKELKKYKKEEYIYLFLAVIQQESGGQGEDIFQCSESLGKPPNSINRKTSIKHGVKVLCGYLDHEKIKVSSPDDLEHIKIALQAYNYGGGYITYINDTSGMGRDTTVEQIRNVGKWTQQNALAYQKKMSGGTPRTGSAAEILGPYAYGDAYYTKHVLQYYSQDSGSGANIDEVKGIPENERMQWLFPEGAPTSSNEFEAKYKKTINVPIYDVNGKKSSMNITIHKKLEKAYKKAFEGMYKIKFRINAGETCAYCWRSMSSGTGSLSHHSYGVAIDINTSANPATYTGGTYAPGKNPLSLTQEVVKIWKDAGFYWGGDWEGYYKDYMHFTYTNH